MFAADLGDPRSWSAARPDDVFATQLHAAAEGAIVAPTRREAETFDAIAGGLLDSALAHGDGTRLAAALSAAPSFAVARHLRRLLAEAEQRFVRAGEAVATMLFAVPIVIVAALETREQPIVLAGVLPDTGTLSALLRGARALGGSEAFGLAGALVGVDAIDIAAMPVLLADARAAPELSPAPIHVGDRVERVHLRFIPGALLAPPRSDPFAEARIGQWGLPFAQALTSALRVSGISLLALPRPAQTLVLAVQAGCAVQREMSAQIFASHAIRKLRASHGEPTAIISAHRAESAPGGGELRLSLSSPFAPKDVAGFRCPVYPYEAVAEVAAALHALMRDCRVTDVRFASGVHADIDPVTGGPLFFKTAGADSIH